MKVISISKQDKALRGRLVLPASKSISNRLLIIRALAAGDFTIHNLSESGDTLLLQELLSVISQYRGNEAGIVLDTGNAGTVMRFLAAFLAFQPGKWILEGSGRMKERPIGALVEALRTLGATIEYLSAPGFPPLLIKGTVPVKHDITIDPGISSQFISALLLTGNKIPGGLTICLQGKAVSWPYIDMTIKIMDHFGVKVTPPLAPPLQGEGPGKGGTAFFIPNTCYVPRTFSVEADWSSAAFWYEAAALSDEVDLVLEGLHQNSLQGDSILDVIFRNFGIQTEFIEKGIRLTKHKKKIKGFDFDFKHHPDIAPAVITTCAALGLPGRFEGLKSLKIKESDRIFVLQKHFEKMGVKSSREHINDPNPVMEFGPSEMKPFAELTIEPSGDHRMAMAFAPLALKFKRVRIEDPDVVSKSYPQFWEHMRLLGFEISDQTDME